LVFIALVRELFDRTVYINTHTHTLTLTHSHSHTHTHTHTNTHWFLQILV